MSQIAISFLRPSAIHPKGGNSLLTAQFKSGKTTLCNNLIRSLADHVPFLGFETRELGGRVALWNYEVIPSQERAWLRRLQIEHPERAAILHARGYRIPLMVPHVQDWAVEWLRSREVEFWIIDPFARAYGGNENDNAEVGRWLEALDEIKRRAGVVDLLLTTHTGRASDERTRGATRLDDWPDSLWMLTKSENGTRYFRAEGRGVDVREFPLSFDEATGQVTASADAMGRKEATRLGNAQLFATVVAEHEGSNTTILEDRWPKNKNLFGAAKNAALELGLIHVHPVSNAKLHYSGPKREGCHGA